MASRTGTHGIADLLANKQTTVAAFGMDNIIPVVNADLAAHRLILNQQMSEYAEVTSDRLRLSGGSDAGDLTEMDEYGRPPTQKPSVGSPVGFPLRLFGYAIGWTRKWFETKTVSDLALAVLGAERADAMGRIREFKKSIYVSANYTFLDDLVAPIASLGVKRFANADGQAIPNGPNGEVFDGATHTHYTAAASLAVADVLASINSVVEHGHGAGLKTAIAVANEAAFRALTGFVPYVDSRLILGTQANQPGMPRLDATRLDNRAIGLLGASEIWIKPWAIAGYAFTSATGDSKKPVVLRTRNGQMGDGLAIAAELDAYPLHARFMEDEFGFGVWTRTNGAVHQSTNATYQDPTITS